MKQDHEEQQRSDDETVVTETQEGNDSQKDRVQEREGGSLDVGGQVFQKEEVNASKQYMKSAVTRILGAGANAPQCDPVKQEQRKGQMSSNVEYGAATAFNATAMNFLTNMLKLFKGDVLILKMIQELHKHMGNKHGMLSKGMPSNVKPVNVPALLFARQTTQVLELPSGESKTISDLIMDKNEYLAVGDYNVKLLNMLNFKDKYKLLNEKNKEYVWTTLNKLLMSSAMVVMIEHDSMSAVDDLICAVMKKSKTIAKSSGGRMDVKKASQMIATDRDIQKVSKQVLKSAMAGDENVSQKTTSGATDAATAASDASQKISSEQMGEYIAQVTGKTVDVTGLADKDGMIDMTDAGMERMMNMLSSQGANCVRKETAKEAVTRERLKKKLLQRQLEKNAAAPATTTTTTAGEGSSSSFSLPSHAVDQTVQLLMSDAPLPPQQPQQPQQSKKKKKQGGSNAGQAGNAGQSGNTSQQPQQQQPPQQQQQHGGESDRERNRRMKSEVDELMRKMQLL